MSAYRSSELPPCDSGQSLSRGRAYGGWRWSCHRHRHKHGWRQRDRRFACQHFTTTVVWIRRASVGYVWIERAGVENQHILLAQDGGRGLIEPSGLRAGATLN